MSAGKGMAPRNGYNWAGYGDKYDAIFRKKAGGTMQKPVGTTQKPPVCPCCKKQVAKLTGAGCCDNRYN